MTIVRGKAPEAHTMSADLRNNHLTRVYIHLDRITHNMNLLQALVGDRPLWPAIKANAYGHGSEIFARHLIGLGYKTLCVAHLAEAVELVDKGIEAQFIILSPTLAENSADYVHYGFEPVVCNLEMIEGLANAAKRSGRTVAMHLKVDTGMGRVGIEPHQVTDFLDQTRNYSQVSVKGIMSHFPRADEADKSFSENQISIFQRIKAACRGYGIQVNHFANSAAILDLPEAYFDAGRPGISIYGLKPSRNILNPKANDLKPVLEWKTKITFLKEVEAGTGISYGHIYHTDKSSLIASLPIGYGDGLNRQLSNKFEVLVGGMRCPQVGRICMDQSLVDVTALRGRVKLGDEVVMIGRQGDEEVTADELAGILGTINYEIVTAIAGRVPRIPIRTRL
jgi:alanine racemase